MAAEILKYETPQLRAHTIMQFIRICKVRQQCVCVALLCLDRMLMNKINNHINSAAKR